MHTPGGTGASVGSVAGAHSQANADLTLDACLDFFSTTETLEEADAWYCPKCKEHRLASKTLQLWSLPPVLVFHLKRFTYDEWSRDKNETPVCTRCLRSVDECNTIASLRPLLHVSHPSLDLISLYFPAGEISARNRHARPHTISVCASAPQY